MADGRQARREGGRDVVADAVDREPLALPGEVVVVGDHRDPGLGDQLGEGQPKRQVERDRERVLHEQQVEVEVADERVELGLQVGPQLVDPSRDGRWPNVRGEVVPPPDRRVLGVGGPVTSQAPENATALIASMSGWR